jgi:hypothetical protein
MQPENPFEDFMIFFCEINQNSCFSIFPTSIPLNISTFQRNFFEVFIFFCNFLTIKGDPKGVRGRLKKLHIIFSTLNIQMKFDTLFKTNVHI